jgi:uncharacterized protein (DUF924 family)/photosystem II stability/assembly factor-like uncharacterized protein
VTNSDLPDRAKALLDVWFGTQDDPEREKPRGIWFKSTADFDAALRRDFLADYEVAAAGALASWEASPEGALALVLLLDQIPRNIFRDTPRAYATDPAACAAADRALARGFDQMVPPVWRRFFYMPFHHSENIDDQRRSQALFDTQPRDPDRRGSLRRYGHPYIEVIERFGRFPHRNAILGRESTPTELAFLAERKNRVEHADRREEFAMTDQSYVYAGVGWWRGGTRGGVFRLDLADGEVRHLTHGLPEETHVQAVTLHPENPEIVYIGTEDGPYRSTDRGEHWERLGFPDRGTQIWSILVDPKDPKTLYAGTSPVAVYRSQDGGDNWRRLAEPRLPERVRMPFACRVMRLAKDPGRPAEIYAVLEVNGVMRSLDDGESWEDCSADLIRLAGPAATPRDREGMLDGHALSVSPAGPSTVFVAVRKGLFRSADRGSSWQDMEIGRFSPLRYGRDIRVSPHDPRVLYACLSPAAQSTDGALYRSDDSGGSWRRFDRGVKAEATMMGVALHPRDPDQVYGVTRCGQIFATRDGGHSWHEHRLPAGCEDTYAIACG